MDINDYLTIFTSMEQDKLWDAIVAVEHEYERLQGDWMLAVIEGEQPRAVAKNDGA